MKKERIKKALAALSVAALLAGVTLTMTGCKTPGSSCSSCKAKTSEEADSPSSGSTGGCGAK